MDELDIRPKTARGWCAIPRCWILPSTRHGSARCTRTLLSCDAVSGEPLYRAYGFVPVERLADDRGGAGVPLVRMAKDISS